MSAQLEIKNYISGELNVSTNKPSQLTLLHIIISGLLIPVNRFHRSRKYLTNLINLRNQKCQKDIRKVFIAIKTFIVRLATKTWL